MARTQGRPSTGASIDLSQTLVFTDGAARGNPGPAGWGVVIATPDGQIVELGGGARRATNNQMELQAVIEALKHLREHDGPVTLLCDSRYVIDGATGWIHGWVRRGWRTAGGGPVKNIDYWKHLQSLLAGRKERGPLTWHHVRGHAGVPGNERVDRIATAFADGRPADLYRGGLVEYDVPIHDIPEPEPDRPRRKREAKAPGKPFCYLSLVAGQLEEHASWGECEARVKGRSGARFRKAMSADEASAIKREWGVA